MAELNEVLAMDRLPAAPAALARAVPLLLDPGSDWSALEKVIGQDEAMTASVLRLANSAHFGGAGAFSDLRRAMVRLGRDTLRRCVLGQQVSCLVGGENAAYGLERGSLWRSSLGGAILAEDLAQRHGFPDAALAFTCGLLRDIGKLALNTVYGDRYTPLITQHLSRGVPFVEAETRALGFDHALVGGMLARRWGFPERVAAAISHHHAPPAPGPGHDVLFDLTHAADTIGRWAGLGVGHDGLDYPLAEHVRSSLRLDRRSVEREIALVWGRLVEAEGGPGVTKQGAVA